MRTTSCFWLLVFGSARSFGSPSRFVAALSRKHRSAAYALAVFSHCLLLAVVVVFVVRARAQHKKNVTVRVCSTPQLIPHTHIYEYSATTLASNAPSSRGGVCVRERVCRQSRRMAPKHIFVIFCAVPCAGARVVHRKSTSARLLPKPRLSTLHPLLRAESRV